MEFLRCDVSGSDIVGETCEALHTVPLVVKVEYEHLSSVFCAVHRVVHRHRRLSNPSLLVREADDHICPWFNPVMIWSIQWIKVDGKRGCVPSRKPVVRDALMHQKMPAHMDAWEVPKYLDLLFGKRLPERYRASLGQGGRLRATRIALSARNASWTTSSLGKCRTVLLRAF